MKSFQQYISEAASSDNIMNHPDLDSNPEMKKKALETIKKRNLERDKKNSALAPNNLLNKGSAINKAPSSAITPYKGPKKPNGLNNILDKIKKLKMPKVPISKAAFNTQYGKVKVGPNYSLGSPKPSETHISKIPV